MHAYAGAPPPRVSGSRPRPRPFRDAKGKDSAREGLSEIEREVMADELARAKAKIRVLNDFVKGLEAKLD